MIESAIKASPTSAKFIVLKPAGYPMKSDFEHPEINEPRVFDYYAKEQWVGASVKKGDYLFDRRMYPDFAFEIMNVEPKHATIGKSTVIVVQEMENTIPQIAAGVSIEDIIGQESAKKKCRLIERYLKDPESFGRWAPKNILFFGPSGTGKTMTAKALSSITDAPILTVKSTQLIGEHVGEGAARIHLLYSRAKDLAPCILFFDELDAIGLDRSYQELRGDVLEIVNALLTEMDGIEDRSGVCTIGATNRHSALDQSVRSRFEEEIEFSLPNREERLQILVNYSQSFPLELHKTVDLAKIASRTQGFSGRDLVEKVLKIALHQAIIDETEVKVEHFDYALSKIKVDSPPSILFT
ncbi:MAG: AAA family ATPase [Halobacteriota archaeon]